MKQLQYFGGYPIYWTFNPGIPATEIDPKRENPHTSNLAQLLQLDEQASEEVLIGQPTILRGGLLCQLS